MLTLYLFVLDEKNDKLKERIRGKLMEYLERAETLQTFLNAQEENNKVASSPASKNGAAKTKKV